MMGEDQPREYTEDEVREKFLIEVNEIIQFWENEVDGSDSLRKLEGLAYSIMGLIDGKSPDLPGYILAPDPHPEAKELNTSRGLNYFPENLESSVKCDISGDLQACLKQYRT